MHPDGIGTVGIYHAGGDSLSEVGLEAVDPLVQQRAQIAGEPVPGRWIGEVDQRHPGLPDVPLPDAAVGAAHQEAALGAF